MWPHLVSFIFYSLYWLEISLTHLHRWHCLISWEDHVSSLFDGSNNFSFTTFAQQINTNSSSAKYVLDWQISLNQGTLSFRYVGHCFQNRTRSGGWTVKTGNRDENRFFKPKEPDILLISWTSKTGVGLLEPVRTVRSNPLAFKKTT